MNQIAGALKILLKRRNLTTALVGGFFLEFSFFKKPSIYLPYCAPDVSQSTKKESEMIKKRNLIERLNSGPVICAEGFLFEIERRGYMASGEFVPMVSLEHPEALENLHRDFQHAGSDIVQAFTYNGHREKMRVINKEKLLEPLNRAALKIAKKVATNPIGKEPNLMAGNISNSNIWNEKDPKTHLEVEKMFSEMVGWAVEEGADMLIGETFYYAE